jgi:hypothetical protein
MLQMNLVRTAVTGFLHDLFGLDGLHQAGLGRVRFGVENVNTGGADSGDVVLRRVSLVRTSKLASSDTLTHSME